MAGPRVYPVIARATCSVVYGRSARAAHTRASIGAPLEVLSSPLQRNGAMWCITRQPALEGAHGPQEAHRSRRGGAAVGEAEGAAVAMTGDSRTQSPSPCCVRRPSAGRPKGGGGEIGPAEHAHRRGAQGRGTGNRSGGNGPAVRCGFEFKRRSSTAAGKLLLRALVG